jgi:predicted outer membrane protein
MQSIRSAIPEFKLCAVKLCAGGEPVASMSCLCCFGGIVNRFVCLVSAVLLASSAVAAASAADARPGPFVLAGSRAAEPRPVSSAALDDDRAVVTTIVMNAVTEIRLCAFALDRSENAEVRSFCRGASSDSARTAAAGMQLAKAIGAAQARLEPAPELQQLVDSFAPLHARDFDRAFLLSQIDRAEEDEHNIRYAMEVASESSLKRYESAVLARVERDFEIAEGVLTHVMEAGT